MPNRLSHPGTPRVLEFIVFLYLFYLQVPVLTSSHNQEEIVACQSWRIQKVLEHVPLLLYILAAKTLILCLAFAGVKIYQRKRLEAKQQKLEAEKKTQSEKKEN
uniref:Small integral membrane protein 11A n=1 Tax=Ursus maritimus TaxID=29073 RepID=A0A452V2R6_URSMA